MIERRLRVNTGLVVSFAMVDGVFTGRKKQGDDLVNKPKIPTHPNSVIFSCGELIGQILSKVA